jgi:hypothetical protein
MINYDRIILVVILLITLYGSKTHAAYTIFIQPNKPSYNAGETVSMSVYAYAPGTATNEYLESFRLGFDMRPTNGLGYASSDFSNFQGVYNGVFSSAAPGFVAISPTSNPTANFDFRASGSRDPAFNGSVNNLFGASSTSIKLMTISFDISSTAVTGSYNFVFASGAKLNSPGSNFNQLRTNDGSISTLYTEGGPAGLFVGQGGSFNVQGIPEPTTITLLAIGLAGGVACRRFRKRSSSVGPGTTDPSTNEAKV